MYRLFRRKKQPPPLRGRGSVPWTAWEITLIVVSLLLIVFPLYAEAYRWLNPLTAPAAQRQQDLSATPDVSPPPAPGDATPVPVDATATTPAEPPTEVPPGLEQRATETPVGTTPTNTSTGATNTPTLTNTPGGATNTSTPSNTPSPTNTPTLTLTPGGPTNTPTLTLTPGGPTNTPTLTLTPGGPTNTPSPTTIITEPPLTLAKLASASIADIGEQFSFSISVFSTSSTPRTVQVSDTLDQQLEFVSASASSGSCSNSAGVVTCSNISVQVDGPATISINVRVSASATPGGRISNRATAQDDQGITALSDQVFVDISNIVAPPTWTTGPTTPVTITPVTITPVTPVTITPVTITPVTPVTSVPPTTPPQPPPTTEPKPPGPPGDDEDTPVPPPPPTTPPQPPLPPTPRPGQPAPTARPGPARTAVPLPARTPGPGTPTATGVPGTPSLPTPEAGLFFRMNSDWGSAFAGQEVIYVIAVRNTRAGGVMRNLQITSDLPANLEILEDSADRGDPMVVGNQMTLKLDALQPNEGVEIAIKTRIKDDVANGTRIVSQAELTFDGLALPAHSNIVTVLVVAPAQIQAQPQVPAGPVLQATAVITATATAAPTQTSTTAPTTAAPTQTTAPTATARATATAVAGAAPRPDSPALPSTSSGVPIFGFALLGMTLMVRTVRVHRAQSRI